MRYQKRIARSNGRLGKFALAALIGAFAATGAMAQEQKPIVKMATSPVGSAGYAIATAMAKVVSDNAPYRVELSALTGSGAIADLLTRGEIGFGFMTSIDQMMAYQGQKPYKRAYHELRLMSLGSPWRTSIAVRADSPFKKIADLKGHRIAGAYIAHPVCGLIFRALLADGGLKPSDVTIVPVPHAAQGVQALIEGRVDAAGCSIPEMGLMKEADAKFGVRYLPIDDSSAAIERAQDLVPVLEPQLVKGGKETGVKTDTEMFTYAGAVAASDKTPDKEVFNFLKAMWNNGDELKKLNRVFNEWGHKEMAGSGQFAVPFQKGAVEFYKSVGMWTPAHEKRQEALLKK